MSGNPKESELRVQGLSKVDADLDYYIGCLREMLESVGQRRLARLLPWGELGSASGNLPRGAPQILSLAFQILNLVEENAAAHTRRRREAERGFSAESGLWGQQLRMLRELGAEQSLVAGALPGIRVEPVLTAHPTEAKRTAVLERHRELYSLMQRRDRVLGSQVELKALRREILACLERLWRTGETLLEKPRVTTERDAMLHYLRDVFPEILPLVDQRLEEAWDEAGWDLELLGEPSRFPKLRFGSWVGGDRDGHPLVTEEVTAETLREHRLNAVFVIFRALSVLRDKLSFSSRLQQPSKALAERLRRMRGEVERDPPPLIDSHGEDEPWREFVRMMKAKLPLRVEHDRSASIDERASSYRMVGEVERDLHLLRDSLIGIGARRVAKAEIDPLLRKLDTFGFHLAALDIRQNSGFHEKALAQLLDAAGLGGRRFLRMDGARRLEFLLDELESPRPLALPGAKLGAEAEAVLGCYRCLARHIDDYGPDGIGALIVSMTRNAADLFTVIVLAREAGLVRVLPDGMACILPVVPLFETIDDLDAAPGIMRQLLAHPLTRRSLTLQHRIKRRAVQGGLDQPVRHSWPIPQVMIGYSDSNKDSGIIASQWALQRAQQEIHAAGADYGVGIRFFHGRGGTVSRGAGPTHRFLDALPHDTTSGDVRLTEQGETVAQKYNNRSTASYHIELLMAGVAGAAIADRLGEASPPVESRVMERLCASSRARYRELLESDGFIDFYSAATPIDALETSGIGSRPARRTGRRSLADLRAIPWVFSWSQSRFYLTGWYGVGSALDALRRDDPGGFGELAANSRKWRFSSYLLANVATSLASASVPLMREYAALVPQRGLRRRFMQVIEAELELSHRMLGEILGQGYIERRPRMRKTLELRERPLEALHRQQIRLLRKWRKAVAGGDQETARALRPDLLLSINAIASGLRTTG